MLEEQISKKDRWLRKKYGCVEFGTGPYDHNYAKVPHQSDCVNGQEHQERGCLEAGVSWEVQEDEHAHRALISFIQYHGSWFKK